MKFWPVVECSDEMSRCPSIKFYFILALLTDYNHYFTFWHLELYPSPKTYINSFSSSLFTASIGVVQVCLPNSGRTIYFYIYYPTWSREIISPFSLRYPGIPGFLGTAHPKTAPSKAPPCVAFGCEPPYVKVSNRPGIHLPVPVSYPEIQGLVKYLIN